MVFTSEHFIARLFVHCCCFLLWTAGSPVSKVYLQTNSSSNLIQRTSPGETGRESIQSSVPPKLQETSQLYSDEYFLEANGGTMPVHPSHDNLKLRPIVKRHAPNYIRVPQYMMDIYTHLQDKKWIPRFDIARSYNSIKNVYTHLEDVENTNNTFYGAAEAHHTFRFNITRFPNTEKIEFAQFRLYTTNNEDRLHHFGNRIRISVFWTVSGTKEQLIEFRDIHNPKNSSMTFSITGILNFWISNPELHQQLKVHVQNLDHTDHAGARVSRWLSREIADESQILIFSSKINDATNETGHSRIRKRRALDLGENFPFEMKNSSFGRLWEQDWNGLISHVIKKRSEDDDEEEAEEMSNYIGEEPGKVRKGKLKKKKNPCKRRPLHVNFASINYDQWIIAPLSYEAFECTGKCTFPMSAHLTPTNHAIIQTLIHGLEPKGVARACCVPTKLEHIPVLYVDDNGVVTYKSKYEDMVVTECGCR